jgi:hypothetical protein
MKWISRKEKLPEKSMIVVASSNDGWIDIAYFIENGINSYFCICQDVKETWPVDYWLEIPEKESK